MKKSDLSILIIEDDAAFCRTLTEAVKSFGYRPLAVGKVDEALQLAKIKSIHAAVIDCVLPKMNGVDLAKEIRKTRFGKAPIILMSGILKDRSFMQDSKDSTQAVEFLSKPFDLNELRVLIDKNLSHLIEDSKVSADLKSIVAKNFQTVRQRIKVIEALENIKGWDLVFILGILAEAKVSGQLNLVSESGDIAGVTLSHGVVVKVDVPTAKKDIKKMLEEKGLVDEEDEATLNMILEKDSQNFVEEAVTQSLISPHMMADVESGIIHLELEQLFIAKSLQISYAPGEHSNEEKVKNWDAQNTYFSHLILKRLPVSYLSEFYEQWENFPLHIGTTFNEGDPIFQMSPYKEKGSWKQVLSSASTIEELTQTLKLEKDQVLRLIHLLVVRRQILFDDYKKVKTREELEQKIQTLFENTVNKTPTQIFSYFGLDEDMKKDHVEKVFHDFARSNHPDQVPKEAGEALKQKMSRVFASVSEAYNILTDDKKREFYFKNIKVIQAAKQMNAENMVVESQQLIRKGQYFLALGKLKEAYEIHPTADALLQIIFCEIKSAPQPLPIVVQTSVQKRLDSLKAEDKKNALFLLISALLAKAKNDIPTAMDFLSKAITADSNMLEARRELTAIQASVQQKKDENILTGDLSTVFSKFFKKKSS